MEDIEGDDFIESLSKLSFLGVPYSLAFIAMRKALKVLKKNYIEDKIKDVDRKELFSYLIQNRIFIESLSDNEIKDYYKYFKQENKKRFIHNLKLNFCLLFRSYRNL